MDILEYSILLLGITFSVYGFIQFILDCRQWFQNKNYINETKFIFEVMNNEDTIEGVIRGLVLSDIGDTLGHNGAIYVVDKGSTDQTRDIVRRLSHEYPYIQLIEEKG